MKCREKNQLVKSQIIEEELAYQGKWLGMKLVTFSIGKEIIPKYECVFRTTKKPNIKADGVQIIPIIKYKEQQSEVVLIANFRPPVKGFCLQFPSGLVENQNYEENVKRELLEETGYVLNKLVEFPLPTLWIDPWKSNESTLMYIGIIDGDDPNHKQNQFLEAEENIRVITLPLDQNLPKKIDQLAKKEDYLIEGKLWSICTGLILSSVLK